MMQKIRLSFLWIGLLAGLQFAILPVWACSGDFRRTTLPEHVDDASIIVVGTVTGSSSLIPYEADYTIQVESYLKGEGPDVILAAGYGTGGGDCLDAIAVGERWLFLLDGNAKTNDILQASYLQVYDSIMNANDENIAAVVALTGQKSLPYASSLWTMLKYWTYSPVFKALVVVGIPAVVIIGGLAMGARFRKRGKAKKKNG